MVNSKIPARRSDMMRTSSSSPALRRALGARDYFTLAFGTMIGVGWMVVIDDWLTRGGAIGTMAGFLIGGWH
jgi:basic amino acid/polyamine antiporter, APA family